MRMVFWCCSCDAHLHAYICCLGNLLACFEAKMFDDALHHQRPSVVAATVCLCVCSGYSNATVRDRTTRTSSPINIIMIMFNEWHFVNWSLDKKKDLLKKKQYNSINNFLLLLANVLRAQKYSFVQKDTLNPNKTRDALLYFLLVSFLTGQQTDIWPNNCFLTWLITVILRCLTNRFGELMDIW